MSRQTHLAFGCFVLSIFTARPDGVAEAPGVYITDSRKGKIWRVIYQTAK